MRIGIFVPMVTTEFEDEQYYDIQAYGLAAELVRLGHEVDVYSGAVGIHERKVKVIEFDRGLSFNVIQLPVSFVYSGHTPFIKFSPKDLLVDKYDVVITSEIFQPITLSVAYHKKSMGNPQLIVLQGIYDYASHRATQIVQYMFIHSINKYLHRKVDFVISKTTAAEQFMKRLGYNRVTTIPVGIPTKKFAVGRSKHIFERLGLSKDDKPLLYVGRLEPRRNFDLIFNAIKRISFFRDDAKFIFIGDGSLRDEVYEMSKNLENVFYLGKIPNQELPKFYSSAYLSFLPMRPDTQFIFGMVILESMAAGTPIVTMPIPAAIDIIENMRDGVIVPFSSSKIFADTLMSLLDNDAMVRRMGNFARRKIVTAYSWEIIAKKYDKLFSEIAR